MRDFVSPQRKDERTVGGLLDVNLGRQLETFGGRLGYQRDLRTSSAGEDLEVDRLYANLQYEWRPRWVLGLEGSLFFTREDGGESGTEEDRRFFEVASSVTYRLTESHDVALGYSYSRETDRTRDENPSADRNRVWLSVQFRFPAAL
jgi:hypothetical protein